MGRAGPRPARCGDRPMIRLAVAPILPDRWTRSTSAPTPSPGRPPRCAAPWPRPRWATTSSATTPPSRPPGARRRAPGQGGRPLRGQRHDGQPRVATWPTWGAAGRSSPAPRATSSTTRPAGHAVVAAPASRRCRRAAGRDAGSRRDRGAFRDPMDVHEPITALVMLENTNADSMGQPLTAAYTSAVAAVAHEHGVPLHVDGARLCERRRGPGHPRARAAGPPTR